MNGTELGLLFNKLIRMSISEFDDWMHDVVESDYSNGYDNGVDDGYSSGYDDGYNEGYENGIDEK